MWKGKSASHFFSSNKQNESWTQSLGHQLDKCVGHPTQQSQTRLCSVSGHRNCGDVAARVMGKGWEQPAELRTQVVCIIVVRYVSANAP